MSSSESLKKRLGYLRSRKLPEAQRTTGTREPRERSGPAGWNRIDRYVWERLAAEVDFPGAENGPPPLLYPGAPKAMRFFDLETTGLSGGAGTTAFLAGIGIAEHDRLKVYQVFLSDFPGEAAFLRALTEKLPAGSTLVSYNGKSYDSHLLKTRCLMNGIAYSPSACHADLLYPARRLFRGVLGGCSLKAVEEGILNIHRKGDIDGSLIPDVYFEYLKDGMSPELEAVFRHNVQDILSLAQLLTWIQRILENPFSAWPVDRPGLARCMLASAHPSAEAYLRLILEEGSDEAGRLLGYYLKRRKRYEEAAQVWITLAERYGDLEAAVEQAKYLEHRCKKPGEGLKLLQETLKRRPERTDSSVPGLEHRMNRLKRKSFRVGSTDPDSR